MIRKPFYIYKRQKQSNSYYYVCYIDPITGKQNNAKSLDTLKLKLGLGIESIRHREEAALIAYKALELGLVFNNESDTPFSTYCLNFWNYSSSTYINLRNKIKPDSLSKEYCFNMMSNIKNHVIPSIPKGLSLNGVKTYHLDKIVEESFNKGLSNGTIQLIILAFSIPLKEAVRTGLIYYNPAINLLKIPRNEKIRGVFTNEEIFEILNYIKTININIRLSIILAIVTGMRSGEIRALKTTSIIQNYIVDGNTSYDKIIIEKSIAPYSGEKCTKSKYSRFVLIPSELSNQLFNNANGNNLVVQNTIGTHLSSTSLRLEFYKVLDELNIDRINRNLTFHSLRHYFATYTKEHKVEDLIRMQVLGHKSLKVNKRYTHISDKSLLEIAKISAKLI